jgi:para-aminobenzoate synthetase component 2
MPRTRWDIAIIDNRDSFVFNLSRYLEELGARTRHFENTVQPAALADFDALLISPGPGTPKQAGNSIEIVTWASEITKPLLGVCLGHQVIAHVFGCEVTGAPELIHGYTSRIHHEGQGIFAEIPSSFKGARYHSLAVREVTPPLLVTARSDDGTIMGLQHETLPIFGVQFHPESILTEYGHELLRNWLNLV